MKKTPQKQENELNNLSYLNIMARVCPDLNPYNYSLNYSDNTDDLPDEIILNDIMERYYGAWKKLAEL